MRMLHLHNHINLFYLPPQTAHLHSAFLHYILYMSRMEQHIVLTFLASLNPLIFTFFVFFRGSLSLDPFYEACVPNHCGDGNDISYPFFIKGLQKPFCGYPGFELSCNNNGSSVLQISGNDYSVRDINVQSSTFRLLNSGTNSCPLAIRNLTLDPNRFRLDDVSTSDLVFLSNCTNDLPVNLERYQIGSCGNELVMLASDANLGNGMQFCGGLVVAPAELLGGEGRREVVDGGNYAEVVERGFTMSWLALNCGVCVRSGGRCGFNTTVFQFRCFCPDRPRMVRCSPGAGRNLQRVILVSALSAGVVTILIVIMLCFRRKLKWRKKTKNYVDVEIFLNNHEFLDPKRYSYLQVKKMTNSFKVKLGQGGFGSVYKGALSNGNQVAVKVLSEAKGNGEDFINEVASVSRTSHVNIVSLLGFCFEGRQRALIYEFMPNGSLERFLCGEVSSSDAQLGREKLHQIAIGIARGLEYLHSGCNTRILHFDIKPHNILLDQDFCPKISDFGLAKLFPDKRSKISMSHMRGTPGYIAPELFSRNFGDVSHKSDVYSYGMMILDMVGGRRNIEGEVDHTSEIYFPNWLYKKLELDQELGLQKIVSDEENEITRKMIIVGLWCIQTNPVNRPTITKVLEMLEGGLELLKIPPKSYVSSPSRSVGSSTT